MKLSAVSGKIRGPANECLAHYAETLPTDRASVVEGRKPFADFVGVTDSTAQRVVTGNEEPIGENRIRIRFFLWHQGYLVTELTKMSDEIFELTNLFSLGLIELDDIVKKLGCSRHHLLGVLAGRRGCSREARAKARALAEELAKTKSQEMQERLKACGSVRAFTRSKAPPASSPRSAQTNGNAACITVLSALIQSCIPLARLAISDGFSAEEREQLRKATQDGFGVFELSNLMTGLCSETARKSVLQSKETR